MKNILICFPLLFGLCLLSLSGCRNVSNAVPRTYGGMGEYGTDDVELRKDWYHQTNNDDRSNPQPDENQPLARSTALPNAQSVPELQEIPLRPQSQSGLQSGPQQLSRPQVLTGDLSTGQSPDCELNSVIDSLKLTTLDKNQVEKNRAITDDSLSAVDMQTDQRIRQQLRRHKKGVTTIIISHRVSTLCEADLILVLENGKLSDQGTHEELTNRPGLYQQIFAIQSALEDDIQKSREAVAKEGS